MPASLVANVVISGLLTGLVYGLMALGLSVIFGVVRVVNFAHGEMTVVAMYGAFVLFQALHLDPFIALVPLALGLFVIGYALQAALINPFVSRPEHEQFILLVGVALIIANGLLMIFGPDARHVDVPYGYDSFEIGPLLIDKVRVYAALAAIAATAAVFVFFRHTRTGTAIRACADNLVGAGATPDLAPSLTLLAFVIVILGGLGSMTGALLGGVLIGLSEALAGLLIDPSMKSMVSFALLVLVLVLRPQGLLGERS